jgi:chorismate dehydratase
MNALVTSPRTTPPAARTLRIGCVSYLNARPLIHGLDAADDVALTLDVPAKLLDGLRDGRFDVALLPVIDYQRLPGLTLIPAGGIASDGPTLTVRIFSRMPIERVTSLACDPDSHTSVALARVILAERYGRTPEFVDLRSAAGANAEARLLIGDKVVCEEPSRIDFPHQLDLGQAWKSLTGGPFVFAAWVGRAAPGLDLVATHERLVRAREEGMRHVEAIIRAHAVPRGWPADLARQYLTRNLQYGITPRHLEAIRTFHQLAATHGAIDTPPRPLEIVPAVPS